MHKTLQLSICWVGIIRIWFLVTSGIFLYSIACYSFFFCRKYFWEQVTFLLTVLICLESRSCKIHEDLLGLNKKHCMKFVLNERIYLGQVCFLIFPSFYPYSLLYFFLPLLLLLYFFLTFYYSLLFLLLFFFFCFFFFFTGLLELQIDFFKGY